MKIYILSILISIVAARPSNEIIAPTAYVLGTPIQSQYHSQDNLGQYAYGYNDGLSAKVESRNLDGTTQGGYTYYDANGKLQSVSYIADDLHGFRVIGTNLPKAIPSQEIQPELQKVQQPIPVTETAEVLAARTEHLNAVEAVKNRDVQNEIQNQLQKNNQELLLALPKPVEDTLEVAKAKEEHFAAKKEAELRNANLLRTETVLALPEPKVSALPLPAVGLLPSPLQSVAIIDQSTFKAVPLPYGATNYGWSYGYSNLSPFIYDSRYFYPSQKFYL